MPPASQHPDLSDAHVVVVAEEWQVRYWSRRYGVRARDIKRAVRTVGSSREEVERYVREQIRRAWKESGVEGE